MTRWHDDANDDIHGIAFGNEPCRWDGCGDSHIHAFTDAELRARDERIIRVTAWWWSDHDYDPDDYNPIIAAAEADQ